MISIIIPVYNVAPYLSRCLDSCLSQTYQNLEIIAVDDGSTDESGLILDKYAEKDVRIKVIHQANGGHQKARRVGMEQAEGDFLYFLDSDDSLPHVTILQNMLDLFTDDDVQIVIGRLNLEKAGKVSLFPSDVFERVDMLVYLTRYLLCGRTGWNVWGKLYRSSMLKAFQGNPIPVIAGEDALFLITLVASKQGSVCMLNKPVYNYLIHSGSISQTKNIHYLKDNFKVANYVEAALKNRVDKSYLTAFRLLCFSGSFRYGWLGGNYYEYQKTVQQYQNNPKVLRFFKFSKALKIWLLIHFGEFLSHYIYHNSLCDNESKNS